MGLRLAAGRFSPHIEVAVHMPAEGPVICIRVLQRQLQLAGLRIYVQCFVHERCASVRVCDTRVQCVARTVRSCAYTRTTK
jgi:hypothetical protein